MAQGITFTSDAKVTIDLKKYGSKLMDFFRSEGIEEKAAKSIYSKKFMSNVEKGRREFANGECHKVDPNNIWD
ncbi:MAG: hypothetical protein EOM76_02600 [Sphingobacteriia bacterium]|jgi:hypothetical protein|nr:hypothetical protein [Paludibacteraceae bacterium]NCA79067.1 hypothetical protein [Sphingobacteriia bacterium]